MLHHTKTSLSAFALAAALVAVPSVAYAQCTAQVSPAQVSAGERAVPVSITVSEPIGEITTVQAAESSGITLAAASDLPREPLAAGSAPQPIAMGDTDNTWAVYLNLADAQPGTHQLIFSSDRGTCSAEVVVG